MGLVSKLAVRNLRTDRFGTLCAIIGVALGTATVDAVLVLDVNTRRSEAMRWTTNPDLVVETDRTVRLAGFRHDGTPTVAEDAKEETHEDYQVMRSAIRLGSLSAFLVGALIVFFTFGVVVERRKREIALLRSLGALPTQVAQVILLEAVIVGVTGAGLGLFIAFPMSGFAAAAGITTTGRAQLESLRFPLRSMLAMSAVGASTAIFGILRPVWSVLRLDVAKTLTPRFLGDDAGSMRRRSSGITLIAVPFMAAMYVVMRPFFREYLPSLAFFVVEAGLVCVAFFGVLLLVPELVRGLGTLISAALPGGPAAARLLVLRRVQNMGHELAWSVGGLTLVFGMVLSLHIVTRSLKQEVVRWASEAVKPYTYVYNRYNAIIPERALPAIPANVVQARFSFRTPWPNSLYAVDRDELLALIGAGGDDAARKLAERLGPGKTIISTMMARRFDLEEGDRLQVDGRGGKAQLEVVAVTDRVGYVPQVGPYRNSKTYALIDRRNYDLIRPYAAGPGAVRAFAEPGVLQPEWVAELEPLERYGTAFVDTGLEFEAARVRETNRDFSIFDLILLLTTVLAAIGIANNMVLAAHARRRELALYRVLGMTRTQIRELFLIEGAFIGLLGGPLAALLGVPLGYAAIAALEYVSAFDVRFDLPPSYVVLTVLAAIAVALVSAIYPSSRAAAASSAESVHYE